LGAAQQPAIAAGEPVESKAWFYRRGCQEKILSPRRQRGVDLWHPAPVDAGMSFVAAGFSGFLFHVTASFIG
jgi:hypothetical protein